MHTNIINADHNPNSTSNVRNIWNHQPLQIATLWLSDLKKFHDLPQKNLEPAHENNILEETFHNCSNVLSVFSTKTDL